MSVTKKFTKHGNSYTLVITPMKSNEEKQRVSQSVKKINKKYGRTLKHLAGSESCSELD